MAVYGDISLVKIQLFISRITLLISRIKLLISKNVIVDILEMNKG